MSFKGILTIIIIIGAIVGGIVIANKQKVAEPPLPELEPLENEIPLPEEFNIDTTRDKDTGRDNEEEGTMEDLSSEEISQPGSYEAYAPAKIARAETGDVVLFFHAPWCPTCRTAESDITANLSLIPPGLTILKTDYDSETALKQKYGVTYQSTFVQVDSTGNLISKWSGSLALSDIVNHVQ